MDRLSRVETNIVEDLKHWGILEKITEHTKRDGLWANEQTSGRAAALRRSGSAR